MRRVTIRSMRLIYRSSPILMPSWGQIISSLPTMGSWARLVKRLVSIHRFITWSRLIRVTAIWSIMSWCRIWLSSKRCKCRDRRLKSNFKRVLTVNKLTCLRYKTNLSPLAPMTYRAKLVWMAWPKWSNKTLEASKSCHHTKYRSRKNSRSW